MKKIKDSQSVSRLRDGRTGLDPEPSWADSSTVSGCTSQLEFDPATNRGIPSPEGEGVFEKSGLKKKIG